MKPNKVGGTNTYASRTKFVERLHEAAHWEAYVASAFTREGFYVTLGPVYAGSRKDFEQAIDMEVKRPDQYAGVGVEVKAVRPKSFGGMITVCSEDSFLHKCHTGGTVASITGRELYAHFVFCDPKTGDMVALPKGTHVTLGWDMWDRKRNVVYKVVKAQEHKLVSFKTLCETLRR